MCTCYDKVVEVATRCGYTLSEEQANSVLWSGTAYPFGPCEHNAKMIEEFFEAKPGAPFDDLMGLAHERFDRDAEEAIRLGKEEREARGIVDG